MALPLTEKLRPILDPKPSFEVSARRVDLMRQRVVVTGFGCVTPLGTEPLEVWNRLAAGVSGVRPISLFDASGFPVRIAAEARDWSPEMARGLVDHPEEHARQALFTLFAASQAVQSADLSPWHVDPLRFGVYLGCGEVYADFQRFAKVLENSLRGSALDTADFMRRLQQDAAALHLLQLEPDAPLGYIANLFEAYGPSKNYTTACVSSSVAIGEALETIREGAADVMLAGGAHSMIHPFGITGFHRLNTLTTRNEDYQHAYRPFDRDRDGFVVGEGGVVFVLESLDHALRRNAHIWAEVTGYGATHDAFRITDTRSDGVGAAESIVLALRDARLQPESIDYINAHGSGTALNDKAETAAIKRALGRHAYHAPISSTKAMTGHLTTACGAMEVLVCLLVLARNVIPPTINYDTPDPVCDLDYVPNEARDHVCHHVLNINLGFGGHNVALVLSRYTG